MTNFAFPPPPVTAVPVQGSDALFPVRNIYCVGRNYWAHREEMGVTDRDPPFFFAKCRDAIVYCAPGATVDVPYPPETSNYHHEIELVVAIGKEGSNISTEEAVSYIFGYAIGLDMTRRDLQSQAKEKGRPGTTAKTFSMPPRWGKSSQSQRPGRSLMGASPCR
jgi:fumarylpyruvate hydrolase